ncbi:MAG: hypothetical protein ABIU95_14060, partial [Burkholderiales bacterium]
MCGGLGSARVPRWQFRFTAFQRYRPENWHNDCSLRTLVTVKVFERENCRAIEQIYPFDAVH